MKALVICFITKILLKIIYPFYPVRLVFTSNRYGEILMHYQIYKTRDDDQVKTIWVILRTPNDYLITMIGKNYTVWTKTSHWFTRYLFYPLLKSSPHVYRTKRNDNEWKDFLHPVVEFNHREYEHGHQTLKQMGITKPYVVFFARDDRYLPIMGNTTCPTRQLNMSFNDFIPSIRWVIGKGYQAVRIGRLVHPIDLDIPGFINYADSRLSSDFMDLFILSKAQFAVTSSGGGADGCWVVGTPRACVNWLTSPPFGKDSIYIPQRVYRDGVIQGPEILTKGARLINIIEENDYSFGQNSQDEILDLTQEMHYRVCGSYGSWLTIEDKIWAEYLKNLFKVPAPMGRKFVRENSHWLLPADLAGDRS